MINFRLAVLAVLMTGGLFIVVIMCMGLLSSVWKRLTTKPEVDFGLLQVTATGFRKASYKELPDGMMQSLIDTCKKQKALSEDTPHGRRREKSIEGWNKKIEILFEELKEREFIRNTVVVIE